MNAIQSVTGALTGSRNGASFHQSPFSSAASKPEAADEVRVRGSKMVWNQRIASS
ncbi:MAG: hypothetical protein H6738_02855 [Alphaproteobacteria bacterium]|nr:hypothetical protein [Alphaproteobacteria bacterium]MCB9695710.1 hypothetical protein [Alphaproteobacteria bacterium]